MTTMSRRRFLIIGGAGVVVAAAGGAALAVRQLTRSGSSGTLTFQAIAGLPRPPLRSYASYVIEGQVDLGSSTGTISKTVFAGPPDARLPIALLTRQIRVTGVQEQGSSRHITGVLADPSQLQKGESATFDLVIDPTRHVAQTDFFGAPIELQVEKLEDTSH